MDVSLPIFDFKSAFRNNDSQLYNFTNLNYTVFTVQMYNMDNGSQQYSFPST